MDQQFEDVRDGINNCLTKDGQNAATSDLDIGNFKLQNVADPTAAQEAATKAYVDANTDTWASGDDLLWRGASAPTGWTVQAIDNKALKIVSGSTGSGGTNSFSSRFNAAFNITGGSHSHGDTFAAAGFSSGGTAGAGGGVFAVGASSHTHTITGSVTTSSSHTHSPNLDIQWESFNVLRKT